MANISLADLVTKATARKAFEVAKASVTFEHGDLVLIDESHQALALEFMKTSFIPDEPINRSIGLHWCPELEDMIVQTLRSNLSFMLVDPTTSDVMGMRMMRIQSKADELDVMEISNEPFRKLISFFNYVEEQANYFQRYNVSEAIQFFGLAVAEQYRKQGIGSRLMAVGVKIVENLGIPHLCFKGDATSNYSKKIYDKINLDVLTEVFFEDYKVEGEVVIKNTGEHKSMMVYGKRLPS